LLSIDGLDEKCGVRRNPFNSLPSRALIAILGVDLGEKDNVGNSRERNREFRSSFPPAEDQTNSIMVTRHRRRGYSPRYLGDVGEPETEAHLRAERKVRIQFPPAASQQRTVPAGQLALVGPGIPSSGPAWQALAVSIAYSRKITGSL
jgi:hypothetical protein